MPLWCHLLGRCKADGFLLVYWCVECAAIPSDNCHHEQRPSKVAEERDRPMQQHLERADASLYSSDRGEHERARAEVQPSNHDDAQTIGEDYGGQSANKARCIFLRSIN